MVRFVSHRNYDVLKEIDFTGKTVLELGAAGIGRDDSAGGKNWIYDEITKQAKEVVGLDNNSLEIKNLKKKGYSLIKQDVEIPFDLHKKFDIVLAIKIIEHVSNLKTFMENIKKHLKQNGLLVIITPNPLSISFFTQQFFHTKTDISKYHMHWQDRSTLTNLLESNGFEIVSFKYSHPRPVFNRFTGYLVQMFWVLFPKSTSRQIFCIARLKR